MFKFIPTIIISLILGLSCQRRQCSTQLVTSYDTTTNRNGFFVLENELCDHKYMGKDFARFELSLAGGWKTITGYMNLTQDTLLYMNHMNQVSILGVLNDSETRLYESTLGYRMSKADSLQLNLYTQITSKLEQSFYVAEDTIYRLRMKGLHFLVREDEMMIYFSKKTGIVGTAILLPDTSIISYQGAIFSDTSLTLANKRLKYY